MMKEEGGFSPLTRHCQMSVEQKNQGGGVVRGGGEASVVLPRYVVPFLSWVDDRSDSLP